METPKSKEGVTPEALALLHRAQVAELTELQIYLQLADLLEKKQPLNAGVLRRLAVEAGHHAAIWQCRNTGTWNNRTRHFQGNITAGAGVE